MSKISALKQLVLANVEKNIKSQFRNPRHSLVAGMKLDESASHSASDSFNKMLFSIHRFSDEMSWLSKILTTVPSAPTHGKVSSSKLQYNSKFKRIRTILMDDTTAIGAIGSVITSDAGSKGELIFKNDNVIMIDWDITTPEWTKVDTIGGVNISKVNNGVSNSLFVSGYSPLQTKNDDPAKMGDSNRYNLKIQDSPFQAQTMMLPLDLTLEDFQDFIGQEYLREISEMHLAQQVAIIKEQEAIKQMKNIAEVHTTIDLSGGSGSMTDTSSFIKNRIDTDIASIRASGNIASRFFVIVSSGVLSMMHTEGSMFEQTQDDDLDDSLSVVGNLLDHDCVVIVDNYATKEYILTGSRGDIVRQNSGIIHLPISTDIRFTNNGETLQPIIGLFETVAFARNPADSFQTGATSDYLRYSEVLGLDKIVYGASGGGVAPVPVGDIYIGEY